MTTTDDARGPARGDSVGAWLEELARDPEGAWARLYDVTLRAAVRRRARDADATATDFVTGQRLADARDLRRCRPDTPLAAWVHGCVRRIVAREGRGAAAAGPSLDDVAAPDARDADDAGERGAGAPGEDDARRAEASRRTGRLTARQRAALDLHLAGWSEREAAARLGVGRDAYRELRDRALAALRAPWTDRGWASVAAVGYEQQGDTVTALLLRLHAQGVSLAAAAREAGLPYETARSRLRRARRKLLGADGVSELLDVAAAAAPGACRRVVLLSAWPAPRRYATGFPPHLETLRGGRVAAREAPRAG